VGVNLISPVNQAVNTITTPTYSTSVVSLAGVLVIIFVTVIILGAVAWINRFNYEACPSKTFQTRRKLNADMHMLTAELNQQMTLGYA
jgi:hypothetical protein